MILMIDNYDSFTFNLVQYLSTRGEEIVTVRNDALGVAEILAMKPSLIVLSPGPGRPEDAGICVELIQAAPDDLPLFGVCLGFQAMVAAYGGEIIHAPYLMHGKTSEIFHDSKGVFSGLPMPLQATRYHSLVADASRLPDCFHVSAKTSDGLLMGIRHKHKRQEAVQFHPESYLTHDGQEMIRNIS
jgi:anthranilate synthase/aminodeoxychorismate synthase-like glutamine amidotransferase